jgi:NAD(P)-dependent dehydrogenase (short-subunit alcohol dehydrogenase family)
VLLEGRVAIVAGAGPGLGREIALALARHGADVVLGAPRVDEVLSVAEDIRALGRRAAALPLDIGDVESCESLVKACDETFGHLDVLVNNSLDDGGVWSVDDDDDLDEWRGTMDAYLWGALQMTRAAVCPMKERRDGRIVFLNAAPTWRHQPGYGAHGVATAALESATRTLAGELGPHGIRVNGVRPGYIWGPSVKARLRAVASERGTTPEEIYREVTAASCLGYLPRAAEVARSVLFLVSDLSSPVTGQSIGVDAGQWMR